MNFFSRLDIVLVELDPTRGSEIRKNRPCVIVSPDIINQNSQTLIVSAITHYDEKKAKLSTIPYGFLQVLFVN